jgi:hypothetical protein
LDIVAKLAQVIASQLLDEEISQLVVALDESPTFPDDLLQELHKVTSVTSPELKKDPAIQMVELPQRKLERIESCIFRRKKGDPWESGLLLNEEEIIDS